MPAVEPTIDFSTSTAKTIKQKKVMTDKSKLGEESGKLGPHRKNTHTHTENGAAFLIQS